MMKHIIALNLATCLSLSSLAALAQSENYHSSIVKGAAHVAVPAQAQQNSDDNRANAATRTSKSGDATRNSGADHNSVPPGKSPRTAVSPSKKVSPQSATDSASTSSEFVTHVEKGKTSIYHAPPEKHPAAAPIENAGAPHAPSNHVLTGQAEELATNAEVPQDMAPPAMQTDMITTEAPTTFQGIGSIADNTVKTAPPLGDYQTRSVSDQSYKQFLHVNHSDTQFSKTDVLVFKGKWDKAEHLLDEVRHSLWHCREKRTGRQITSGKSDLTQLSGRD